VTSDPALDEMMQQFLRRTEADGKRLGQLGRQSSNVNEAMTEIRWLVHRLAGTAGTFGFSRLSETAYAVEELLAHGAPDRVLLQDRLSAVLTAIADASRAH